MKRIFPLLFVLIIIPVQLVWAQANDEVIQAFITEANEQSQLELLAHQLTDVIGPRLVGTPQMQHAHDWAIEQFEAWGIEAENQQFGTWRGWERGITHVDLVSPRVVSLEGQQLAWSPATPEGGIEGEITIIPLVESQDQFEDWLASVNGKFVLISPPQITGRPDYNWEEFATDASFEKMKAERVEQESNWEENLKKTGFSSRTLKTALEDAGAAGLLQSRWSHGFGVNKIFSAGTEKIPVIDLSLEDYGMLYRMAKYGSDPVIRVDAQSKNTGRVSTFNTIATIPGTEKSEEYVILSAHFDSWDGGTGATDNATGVITMMEAARILKKYYPSPKRTIIVGLWGSEEQGLNGSSAYVEDNPEIVAGLQALFNQDNGTGRVVRISGQGFLHAYEFIERWMEPVPSYIKGEIETTFPGKPSGGGSDYASFVAAGAPGFSLSSLSWSYWNYTWHTNRDTYDKIVFDDVRNNVILTTILTYMASEDPKTFPREKSVLPTNPRSGREMRWPNPRTPEREGGK